ncbi:hypothetical protein PIB30_037274 [Stylosanthes scabra]|uniref:RNase H type-1 domain-containing protein n=1 Tax=Stylosanthes scabra TaxID=79078 RepID=A0ABU6VEU6_9FABA|nr:hypothetical protein [Stylosanthes scabra]
MGWFWLASSSKTYSCKDGYLWLAKRHVDWQENSNWLRHWRLKMIMFGIGFITIVSIENSCFVLEFGGFGVTETMMFSTPYPWSISKVKGLCLSMAKELENATCFLSNFTPQFLLSSWVPPSLTQVEINCDGSFFPHLNAAGFACVIRDSLGNWIIGAAGTLQETSIFKYELFALWRGLLLTWDSVHRDIIGETDNIHVFRFA